MSKLSVLAFLLAACFGMAGQKTPSDSLSISKAALSRTKSISDLDTKLVKEAKIQSLELVARVKGKVRISMSTANEWNKETRNILDSVDAGTKLYIDYKFTLPPEEKVLIKTLAVKVQ